MEDDLLLEKGQPIEGFWSRKYGINYIVLKFGLIQFKLPLVLLKIAKIIKKILLFINFVAIFFEQVLIKCKIRWLSNILNILVTQPIYLFFKQKKQVHKNLAAEPVHKDLWRRPLKMSLEDELLVQKGQQIEGFWSQEYGINYIVLKCGLIQFNIS